MELVNRQGARSFLAYDEFGRNTSFTDSLGQVHTYEYDSEAASSPTRVTDPDGTFRTVEYDAMRHPTRVVDGSDRVTRYEYDRRGRLVAIIDGIGNRSTVDYSASLIAGTTDALGRVTRFEYDAAGRLAREIDPLGGTTLFAYDAADNLTSQTDPLGRTTTYTYDAVGNLLTRSTNPTTTFEYDVAGNVTAVIDPNGHTTRFEYDALNRLVRRIDALQGERTLQYDAAGNIVAATDENGHTTRFEYDVMDRLIRVIDPLNNVRESTYDLAGNLTSASDVRGNRALFQYDGLGRIVRSEDASGGVTQVVYDGAGRVIQVIDPLGQSTVNEYDAAGNRTAFTDQLGSVYRFVYDAVGNLLSATNPLDETVAFTYDELDRQTSVALPNGSRTSSEYDAVGNIVSVADALGNVTKFEYDTVDRLVRRTDPLGGEETSTFDPAGNLIARSDRNGVRRTFVYDAMNRMLAEHWLDSAGAVIRTESYTYDALGNLLTASDPDIAFNYTYDALGRLTAESVTGTAGLADLVMSYTHDAAGNVVSQRDNLGAEVTSTFTANNLLASRTWQGAGIEPLRVDFDYDTRQDTLEMRRFGDLAGMQLVGSTAFEYDAKRRLTQLAHRDATGNTLVQYDYTRDAADRLVSESHHDQTIDYTNDGLGQILSATSNGLPEESFQYDDNGNRIGAEIVVGPNNQILSDGDFLYDYDAAGNLTTKTSIADASQTEFSWDHRNRLTQVQQRTSGGELVLDVSFVYDLFDRRIARTIDRDGDGPLPAQTEHYLHSANQAWADLDSAGNVSARYLHGSIVDEMLARYRPADGIAWYLGDQLSTVRDVAGTTGQLLDHTDYTTFGGLASEPKGAVGDRFKFAGRELDEELDLYYYRARYYDPNLGRFISEDSYGFDAGDPNLYRYVVNSPTNSSDPSGHVAAFEYATKAVVILEKLVEPLQCIEDNLATVNVEFDPLGALDLVRKPGFLDGLDNAKILPGKSAFRAVTGLKIPKFSTRLITIGEVPLAEALNLFVTVKSCARFLPAAHFSATLGQLAIVLDLYTRSKPHTTVTSAFEASSPDELSQFSLSVKGSLQRGVGGAAGGAPGGAAGNPGVGGPPPASGGGPGGVPGSPSDPDPSSPSASASSAADLLIGSFDYIAITERLFAYEFCHDDPWRLRDRARALGIATELLACVDPRTYE